MLDLGLHLTDAFALLGISLALCAGLLGLLTAWRGVDVQASWVKLLTFIGFGLLWIPLGDANLPVVAYVRGVTADLSITLVVLAVWQICRLALGRPALPGQEHMAVMAAVAVAALFLYPLALGWGDWDAYRPGWGSWGMLLVLLALSSVCWVYGLRLLPALVALALLAWSLGLMESGNLWDYVLDPWLSVLALGFDLIKFVQTALERFR